MLLDDEPRLDGLSSPTSSSDIDLETVRHHGAATGASTAERLDDSAADQQIHTTTPKLPRTRSRENETARWPFLDPIVHDVQQLGCALHLIHHDVLAIRVPAHQVAQSLRSRQWLAVHVWPKQVDEQRVRQTAREARSFCQCRGARTEKSSRPAARKISRSVPFCASKWKLEYQIAGFSTASARQPGR
jgi:hypothetical protein